MSCTRSLHRNQGKVAMNRNLSQSPHRNVIERPLPFEAGEGSFNGCSLSKQGLPGLRVLPYPTLDHQFCVASVDLYDRFRSVLPLYQAEQWLTGIASVRHNEAGMELVGSYPGFPKHMGGSSHVAGIPRRYVGSHRKLGLAVHQDVQLVAQGVASLAVGVLLDRPPSVLVGLLPCSAVYPTFQGSAVEGHSLSEARGIGVAAANQAAGNILDQGRVLAVSQPCKETAERCFMGNTVRPRDTTSLGNPRIVGERANQCRRGREANSVLGNEAVPKDLHWVSFGTTAGRACKGLKQRGIVQFGKERLKLLDDGRRLYGCASGGKISGHHWEAIPSCWLGAVGAEHTCGSVFLLAMIVSGLATKVKRK